MEANNPTTTPPSPTGPTPVPNPVANPISSPPVPPASSKAGPIVPAPTTPRPKNFTPWIIGASILGLILLLIIGVSVGIALIKSAFNYTPPPPAPTPAPEVTIKPVSSKWASDSGVLKLRDDLKTISQSIDSADLIEPQIAPPALDLNINIKLNQN